MDNNQHITSESTVRAGLGDDFDHIFSSHDDLTYLDIVNSAVNS